MPMKSDSSTSVSARPVSPQAREAAERVSFWMDAPELQADAVALDELLAACADDDTHDTWGHYHWLGDVLRQGENAPPPADTAFVTAVMQRVAHEPLPQRMPEAVVPHTTATVVALPVAAPSAMPVASNVMVVVVRLSTRWRPLRPDGVAPATPTSWCSSKPWPLGVVSVATPLATVMVAACRPKPETRRCCK